MPKKTNPQPGPEEASGTSSRTWEDDQRTRGYYYDDSHGYEVYDPLKEDDVADLDESGAERCINNEAKDKSDPHPSS